MIFRGRGCRGGQGGQGRQGRQLKNLALSEQNASKTHLTRAVVAATAVAWATRVGKEKLKLPKIGPSIRVYTITLRGHFQQFYLNNRCGRSPRVSVRMVGGKNPDAFDDAERADAGRTAQALLGTRPRVYAGFESEWPLLGRAASAASLRRIVEAEIDRGSIRPRSAADGWLRESLGREAQAP